MHYYIWSNQHNKWWKTGRMGYTSNISHAGLYSLMQAINICNQANINWCMDNHKDIPMELPIHKDIAKNLELFCAAKNKNISLKDYSNNDNTPTKGI